MTTAPQQVTINVKEFVRLDDGLKKAREEMKVARQSMDQCREQIICYMKDSNVERLSIKKGTQFLELSEKNLKVRPSAECIKSKLKELFEKNVVDPEVIYDEIQKCGGTKQVWKLSRRTKRSARPKDDSSAPPKKKKKVAVEGE